VLAGGGLALAARPFYKWVFLHPAGHGTWTTVCGWFERYRAAVVVLTIFGTAMLLSLYRNFKLTVTGRRAGTTARWRPVRYVVAKLSSRSNHLRSQLRKSLQDGRLGALTRWLGFGRLRGLAAHVWITRRIARADPRPDTGVADHPEKYVVVLADKQREVTPVDQHHEPLTTMSLQSWLLLDQPSTQHVLSLHERESGELIPRRRLTMGQRNTRLDRVLRRLPGLRDLKHVRRVAHTT
jgi:hypothetical protein